MTRFARAKGSKASNERLPESATSWSQMKAELLNKNNELTEKKERDKALKRRQENYQKFLDEKEEAEDKQIAWADFPFPTSGNGNSPGFQGGKKRALSTSLNDSGIEGKTNHFNKQNSGNKKVKTEGAIAIDEDSDGDSDGQFSALKSKLDQILDQKDNGSYESDDEPPEEASIKEKPKEIVVKKAKVPKKKLKIVVDKEQQVSNGTDNSAIVTKRGENTHLVKGNKPRKIVADNPEEELPAKSKKLIEKKLERKKKQNVKKLLKKQQQKNAANNGEKPMEPSEESLSEKARPSSNVASDEGLLAKKQKKLERRKKQKEKIKMMKEASKPVEEKIEEVLSEKDLLKIEKKKERRARQADKRKKIREAKALAAALAEQNGTDAQADGGQENKQESRIESSIKVQKVKAPVEQNKHVTHNENGHDQHQNGQNKLPMQRKPLQQPQIQKKPNPRDNNEHQSRKDKSEKMMINGKEIDIGYVDGFPVKKEDADRLRQLRKEMISKGLPRSEINASLKLERRRAEKALTREKKHVCFNCRKSGHNLSECPELDKDQVAQSGTGICYKCGSTEHTHFECKVVKGLDYKFATCFICQEQGHISKQCPDNQRGLYPKGGSCKVCGDVTHLKKDCPKYHAQQAQLQNTFSVGTMDSGNPDDLDNNPQSNSFGGGGRMLNKKIKF